MSIIVNSRLNHYYPVEPESHTSLCFPGGSLLPSLEHPLSLLHFSTMGGCRAPVRGKSYHVPKANTNWYHTEIC